MCRCTHLWRTRLPLYLWRVYAVFMSMEGPYHRVYLEIRRQYCVSPFITLHFIPLRQGLLLNMEPGCPSAYPSDSALWLPTDTCTQMCTHSNIHSLCPVFYVSAEDLKIQIQTLMFVQQALYQMSHCSVPHLIFCVT